MLYGAPTTRRSDARRNRETIVAAANAVLSGPGNTRLMSEVARRAGVAPATLYRHFPDRYALTAAVLDHLLDDLAAQVAATAGRPEELRRLLGEVLHRQITMRPLVLLAARLDPGTQRRYEQRVVSCLAGPLALARPDLPARDTLLLFTMVQSVSASAGPDAAGRSIALMLDGLFGRP